MLSFATFAPIPQLQAEQQQLEWTHWLARTGFARRIRLLVKRIADLCSKKLEPPLDRIATAISKDATILYLATAQHSGHQAVHLSLVLRARSTATAKLRVPSGMLVTCAT